MIQTIYIIIRKQHKFKKETSAEKKQTNLFTMWSSRKIEINPSIFSSEKKLGSNKYDKMLQSLEAQANKQRKPNDRNGSAKKVGASTKATNEIQEGHHLDNRTAALSISSCISKNTGTNTAVGREKLAQLHALQQHHQQMLYAKHSIFDRNRPWNCDYCQPKTSPQQTVDKKVNHFSRKCVAQMVARFMIKEEFYESRKVVELLNTNSRSVLVAMFKDYLIYDDIYEFLTSLYDLHSCLDILKRHAVFYDSLSSYEVLCQYREEQIRDRHLVLHGLKPCYIGLEKQIQSIIASNLKNKLRLVLNKVRKIQIARGLHSEQSNLVQETESSQFSTPARDMVFKGGARQKTLTTSKRKRDFKKLIQTSMVREYNFSRSQSGLLVAKQDCIVGQDGYIQQKFDTNSSINFTNISLEGEIELVKGSVFDESIERQDLLVTLTPQIQQVENIESMYMNAQLILDDLSSRPLTRQSMPITNVATPASRIQLYDLQLSKEEHKIKLPFNMAPKPFDQKLVGGLDSQTNSCVVVQNNSQEQIMIINQDDIKGINASPQHMAVKLSIFDQDVANDLRLQQPMTSTFENKRQIAFKPFEVPSDDQSLHQSIHSIDSNELQPPQTQGQGQARHCDLINDQNLEAAPHTMQYLSQPEQNGSDLTNCQPASNSHSKSNQSHQRTKNVIKGSEKSCHQTSCQSSAKSIRQQIQRPRDGNIAQPNTVSKPGKSKKNSRYKINSKESHILGTPCSEDRKGSNLIAYNSLSASKTGNAKVANAFHQTKGSCSKNSTLGASSNTKASPNHLRQQQFQPNENKLGGQSTKALPSPVTQTSFKAAHFLAKKASLPVTNFNKLSHNEEFLMADNRNVMIMQTAQRTTEQQALPSLPTSPKMQVIQLENHEKIKVSKKLIASLKGNMQQQMSPNKASRMQALVDREDNTRNQKQQRQPAIKGLAPAKTMGSLVTARAPNNATQSGQTTTARHINNASLTGKPLKSSASKRAETKAGSSRKNLTGGHIFGSEKTSMANLQSSNDNKRNHGLQKQLTLKEQVILEALKRDQSSLAGTIQHRNAQSASGQQQMLTQGGSSTRQSDPQAVKLLRSQQITATGGILTQSKSLVAQKVDLYSIAGKLKLLNAQQCQQRQQKLSSSSNRKNSVKFNSRKVSVEQREDLQFTQRGTSTAQSNKQQAQRFFSPDGFTNDDKLDAEQNNQPHQKKHSQDKQSTMKTTAANSNNKRKFVPATLQLDSNVATATAPAFYTQRSKQNVRALIASPSNKLQGGGAHQNNHHNQQQQIQSRNQQLVENFTDYKANQLQLVVTKTLIDMEQQQKDFGSSRQGVVLHTQHQQKLSKKKTKSKLSRGGTSSAAIETPGILSPRKIMKESATTQDINCGKTRNSNFASGSFTTSSQQRLISAGLPLCKATQPVQQTTKAQTLTRQAQLQHKVAQNFEQALVLQQHSQKVPATMNSQNSRNMGLPMTGSHPTQHHVAKALHELSSPNSSVAKHSLPTGSKMLQSHQSLLLQSNVGAAPFIITTTHTMPHATATLLKQELKLHSRKNSAVYTLSAAKSSAGFQTTSGSQARDTITTMQTSQQKNNQCSTLASTTAIKKTKKKQSQM